MKISFTLLVLFMINGPFNEIDYQLMNKNKEITHFLNTLELPLRKEIDVLRTTILSSNPQISENIKWNSPNFTIKGEDRITMRVQPVTQIQLIFHRGAKKQTQPDKRLIEDEEKMLVWKENDRAILTFKSSSEVESKINYFSGLVLKWMQATS